MNQAEALAGAYGTIAEWLLYPEEIDPAAIDADAADRAASAAGLVDPRIAEHLLAFWREHDSIDVEGYLELLELNPRCPLYLGTHQFPEPTTCSAAGVSDRNQFMLEIGNVYRHFGFEIAGELPDYLPAMVEFLALSSGCEGEEDEALRRRFIARMVVPGARIFADRLEEIGTIYEHLARALLICLEQEVGEQEVAEAAAEGAPPEGADMRAKVVTFD